jgi:hypothetical protein
MKNKQTHTHTFFPWPESIILFSVSKHEVEREILSFDTIINIHSKVTAVLNNKYIAEEEFLGVPKVYINVALNVLDPSLVMLREMINKPITLCIFLLSCLPNYLLPHSVYTLCEEDTKYLSSVSR